MRNASCTRSGRGRGQFTPVPNGMLEALTRTHLTQYEMRVLLAILRKTIGFHKAGDWIANRQFEAMTGIAKPHVCRSLRTLIERRIITKRGNNIGLNVIWSQWRGVPDQAPHPELPRQVTAVAPAGNRTVPNQAPTKEKKETITKERFQTRKAKQREPRQGRPAVGSSQDSYEEQRTFFVRQAQAHQAMKRAIESIASFSKRCLISLFPPE